MKTRKPLPWRDYLTPDERRYIEQCDKARAAWQALVAKRAYIANRAIQRARYAEGRK